MDFAYDEATVELQQRRLAFMDECMYPSERAFAKRRSHSMTGGEPRRSSRSCKLEARRRGLWNLFLPRTHEYGAGLRNAAIRGAGGDHGS